MQPADLENHFAAWHDEDLIRALKIEYRDYEQAYLDSITSGTRATQNRPCSLYRPGLGQLQRWRTRIVHYRPGPGQAR